MILDNLANASRYLNMSKGISDAITYIQSNDLEYVKPGRYEIEGNRLVMIVFEFESTNTDECKLEGHRKYIDLQYWVQGSELMGHEILNKQEVISPYDEKTDCGFYKCLASFTRMLPGMFVVYFPSDLHTAVADPLSKSKVKKIVFKILVEA